jgi:manganese-dependent inorganic pyrophosphatase
MEKLTILGHLNQDTDATCAALGLEEFLNKTKQFQAKVKISDKPNKETEYVLKKFKVKTPTKFTKSNKKEKVFLVDFNEESQSPISFKKAEIEGLVDHHKLDICFKKDYPVTFRVEPIGSSSSIVAKMFLEKELKMSKKIAGLLLSGILSDTLKFTSPTTTEEDKKIAQELAKKAEIKIDKYATKMFEAKSDLTGITPQKLITTDYKNFEFGKKKTGIGVFETVLPDKPLEMEDQIRKALISHKEKENLDLIFFAVVDILKNKSFMLVLGTEEEKALKKTFPNFKIKNQIMEMPEIVSRKKQLVPEFMKKIK